MKGEAASDFLQRNKEEHNMLSDGLKYQDSRMATCEEMKQDLAPFALHDAAAKSKGGPVLLRLSLIHISEPTRRS